MTAALQPAVILLVDDEPLIQDLIQTSLEEAGYGVTGAQSGEDALAILESKAESLGGLVTDVNLGREPNGWKVAARARELNPNLPVIYMSGDSAHDWAAHGVPNSIMITKPFAPIEVVVALATLRNQAAPPGASG
jgi:CheY-like chemotaxis protein